MTAPKASAKKTVPKAATKVAAAKHTPSASKATKAAPKSAKAAPKGAKVAPKAKSAWPRSERRRLSAILHPGPGDPADFYLTPQAAWAALGESGTPPVQLDAKTEFTRALKHRFVSWQERAGRCFSDEPWNALVALWVGVAGFTFAIDLLLSSDRNDPSRDLFSADGGAPWYAVRRYLYQASADDLAAAIAHVRPTFERLNATPDPGWAESRLRAWLAFAFSRGTDWADVLLRRWVDEDAEPGEMMPLASACTDADLALRAVKKYGGFRDFYTVFDLVEAHGKKALPILALATTSRAADKKRVASAQAIAAALLSLALCLGDVECGVVLVDQSFEDEAPVASNRSTW